VHDFDRWIQPHLVHHLHGHNKPLALRFSLDDEKRPGFLYKDGAADKSWRGVDGNLEGKLVRVLDTRPAGRPDWLDPPLLPTPELETGLRACMAMVNSEPQKQWLRDYLNSGRLPGLLGGSYHDGCLGTTGSLSIGDQAAPLNVLGPIQDAFFGKLEFKGSAPMASDVPNVRSYISIAPIVSNSALLEYRGTLMFCLCFG
jgi:hypothetical protein